MEKEQFIENFNLLREKLYDYGKQVAKQTISE